MRNMLNLFNKGLKPLVAVLLLIAIVVAGFFYFNRSKAVSKLLFEKGKRYTYSLNYKNSNSRAMMTPGEQDKVAALMKSAIDLEGSFVIRCYKADKTRYLLGGSFVGLTKSDISFNDKPIFNDPAQGAALLSNKEFLFEMHPDGSIGKIYFDKIHHPLFRNIAKMLLADLRFRVVKKGVQLDADSEKDNYGVVDVVYKRDKEKEGVFTKERVKYTVVTTFASTGETPIFTQKVRSLFSFTLDERGLLQKMKGDEYISFKKSNGLKIFSNKTNALLQLTKVDKFNVDEQKISRWLTSYINEKIGESAITDKAERSMLQQQAKGMSKQEMLTTFKVYGRTGKIYDKNLFLWRGVGFLKLHPEMIKELIPLFKDSSISSEGRMLIFGLLASVGIKEAQSTMLVLLNSETAKNDPYYPLMYQHLTLLEKPDKEVVQAVEQLYNSSKDGGEYKKEAAVSLGAVAYNLRENGQTKDADRLNDALVSDLQSAGSDIDKSTLLDALGNSGDDDNFDEIAPYSDKSNSPNVRASSLNALRRMKSKESTDLLIDMVGDDEPLVKKQAMNTLAHHDLDDNSLAELKKKIESGTFNGSEYLDLLNLLARFQKSNPQAVKEILESFLARGVSDPHVMMRAKDLLDSVNKLLQ